MGGERRERKFLLDPGVQLERGRALLTNPGDVAVDDIREYVGRSIEKDRRRLYAERETMLAYQKRIADLERQFKEAAAKQGVVDAPPRKCRYYISYAWADARDPTR